LFAAAPLVFWWVGSCSKSGLGAATNGPAPVGMGISAQSSSASRAEFDGDRAFKLLVKQCDFGPRPVGTQAHKLTREFLMEEMGKYADKTVGQDFQYKGLPLTNVIGVFNPHAKRSVLLCTHWDTRPRADQEIDPKKKVKPILGASDGASGTAVLLELARIFKQQKPEVGVVLVLLDGEDFGDFIKDEGVFLGSRHFARNHDGYNPEFGVLLDMVGDKNLNILREKNSQRFAPGTNTKIFELARQLGFGKQIIDREGYEITDDHIPLSMEGRIPTIDLIDFDYGPWHTLDDTPDKCSAQSLATVGKLLAELIYRERGK
jgi:glutaminyl-peptide cyclotransferase